MTYQRSNWPWWVKSRTTSAIVLVLVCILAPLAFAHASDNHTGTGATRETSQPSPDRNTRDQGESKDLDLDASGTSALRAHIFELQESKRLQEQRINQLTDKVDAQTADAVRTKRNLEDAAESIRHVCGAAADVKSAPVKANDHGAASFTELYPSMSAIKVGLSVAGLTVPTWARSVECPDPISQVQEIVDKAGSAIDVETKRLKKSLDDAIANRADVTTHLQRIEVLLDEREAAGDVARHLPLTIATLGVFSIAIMVMVRRFREPIQQQWVASGQVTQFMTVMILVIVVLALGITKTLQSEALGTLLGGISGYMLSQGVARIAQSRSSTSDLQSTDGSKASAPRGDG